MTFAECIMISTVSSVLFLKRGTSCGGINFNQNAKKLLSSISGSRFRCLGSLSSTFPKGPILHFPV